MDITKYETNFEKNLFLKESKLKDKIFNRFIESQIINIYPEIEYQTIVGFGAAVTEASGYAFNRLSSLKQEQIIKDYFSSDGLNYSIVRLPIGSCDFSLKSYSYSYKKDLSDFNIENDKMYIFPLLNAIYREKNDVIVMSSPWSPPAFMKNTKMLYFGGKLRKKYKKTFADYFVKYIHSYQELGFNINYLTVQNEPNAIQKWESCLYSSKDEADFVLNYLYPTLRKNGIESKILIWDHNKERLLSRALNELSIEGAEEKISGVAYHYYTGEHFENLNIFREKFPDKLLFHTEGCTGYIGPKPDENPGNGELYAHDILGDLNSGSNGYIDWNLILNYDGGPNHKSNFCNSPIMVTEDGSDYFKNSTFTYIKHFSKFILPGSRRIGFSRYTDNIEVTSFKNPNGDIVVVVLNRKDFIVEYNMCINNRFFKDSIDGHSINTYLINLKKCF